jgi:hypothetical protein
MSSSSFQYGDQLPLPEMDGPGFEAGLESQLSVDLSLNSDIVMSEEEIFRRLAGAPARLALLCDHPLLLALFFTLSRFQHFQKCQKY